MTFRFFFRNFSEISFRGDEISFGVGGEDYEKWQNGLGNFRGQEPWRLDSMKTVFFWLKAPQQPFLAVAAVE